MFEANKAKAEAGDIMSQWLVGLMYKDGEGVEQNYEEAIKWLRLAGRGGSYFAYDSLGSMYENGDGVARDDQKAAFAQTQRFSKGATPKVSTRVKLCRASIVDSGLILTASCWLILRL
jgi:hypothetical protein